MAKATPPALAEMRAVADFCVGVRHVNAGEVFPADDQLVVDLPEQFEPVPAGESTEA